MAKLIDLHAHTTASDGSLTPAELVRHAKAAGLAAVAITDHDTVSGVADALCKGRECGITVLPGVEISVNFKPEMHILGYFHEHQYTAVSQSLEELRENREIRNPKIVKKLSELGFDISLEEAAAEAGGNIIGRPHIAKAMVKKGYVTSTEEAFEKYLASGRPAYVKKDKLTPEQGIELINSAGGIAVLAHPLFLGMEYSALDRLAGELKELGLGGIEAYYVEHTRRDTGVLLRLALRHGLLVTGGSDFHGSFKPGIELGTGRGSLAVPYELLEKLTAAIKKKPILSDGGR